MRLAQETITTAGHRPEGPLRRSFCSNLSDHSGAVPPSQQLRRLEQPTSLLATAAERFRTKASSWPCFRSFVQNLQIQP